jgi:amino acid transporter
VFVTAAFAFSGTELVGLAAAETEDVRRSLPRAVKFVFWRISGVSALGYGKGVERGKGLMCGVVVLYCEFVDC